MAMIGKPFVPGGTSSNQEQGGEQVKVVIHRFDIDPQVFGKSTDVEQTALLVGENGPETAERFGRDARSKGRDVAFQVGSDEILAPFEAAGFIFGKTAFRKTTSYPQ